MADNSHRIGICALDGASEEELGMLRLRLRRLEGVEVDLLDAPGRADIPVLAVFSPHRPDAALAFLQGARSHACRALLACPGSGSSPFQVRLDLLKAGACEILELGSPRLDGQLRGLRALLSRWRRVDEILASEPVRSSLAGQSPEWIRALRGLVEGALAGTQPILLTGETGTGKEAAAALIHKVGGQSGRFVVVDCGSIVATLSGSELFGHRRGAFTGAEQDREGALGTADCGTLFLDECGELRPGLQAEFLRALQGGMYKRVGEDVYRQSRFRLVAATNRNLEDMVRSGAFRSDLYFRMSAIHIELPPLRERKGDRVHLARHFLSEFLQGMPPFELEPFLVELLESHSFEGNVRQLRSLAEAIAGNYDGSGLIRAAHIPTHLLRKLYPAERGWDGEALNGLIEKAVGAGETFDTLVEAVKDGICNAAWKLEGSAEKAATKLRVSKRLIEKRRSGGGPVGSGAAFA